MYLVWDKKFDCILLFICLASVGEGWSWSGVGSFWGDLDDWFEFLDFFMFEVDERIIRINVLNLKYLDNVFFVVCIVVSIVN